MPARSNRRLARLFGIDIQFHWTWLIILYLVAATLGEFFARAYHWHALTVWAAALVTTALFFVSVVLHELAHSLAARAYGLPVHTITLFVFGGVSELTREPDHAGAEFVIAILGPLTSLVIGGVCLGLSKLGSVHQPVFAVLWWLGSINLLLAIFNLAPGFPLDGGRVLRAIIWSANHNFLSATRWATRIGKVVALLFILVGVLQFFHGQGLNGLWIAFIGWFLLVAAEQSWRQTEARSALGSFTVRDLSNPFFTSVSPDETVEGYFHQVADSHNYRASLVMEDGDRLIGVIAPVDLRNAPRPRWGELRVRNLMVPRTRLVTATLQDGLMEALEKMALNNVSQLPVVEGDHVHGVIRRDRILELLQAHLGSKKLG